MSSEFYWNFVYITHVWSLVSTEHILNSFTKIASVCQKVLEKHLRKSIAFYYSSYGGKAGKYILSFFKDVQLEN